MRFGEYKLATEELRQLGSLEIPFFDMFKYPENRKKYGDIPFIHFIFRTEHHLTFISDYQELQSTNPTDVLFIRNLSVEFMRHDHVKIAIPQSTGLRRSNLRYRYMHNIVAYQDLIFVYPMFKCIETCFKGENAIFAVAGKCKIHNMIYWCDKLDPESRFGEDKFFEDTLRFDWRSG